MQKVGIWKLVANDKVKCSSYQMWTNAGPDSQESWTWKKKKKGKYHLAPFKRSLEMLEEPTSWNWNTSSPNIRNYIKSVSISCNWKTFPVNTNILNNKPRASNLYWTRLTLASMATAESNAAPAVFCSKAAFSSISKYYPISSFFIVCARTQLKLIPE